MNNEAADRRVRRFFFCLNAGVVRPARYAIAFCCASRPWFRYLFAWCPVIA